MARTVPSAWTDSVTACSVPAITSSPAMTVHSHSSVGVTAVPSAARTSPRLFTSITRRLDADNCSVSGRDGQIDSSQSPIASPNPSYRFRFVAVCS